MSQEKMVKDIGEIVKAYCEMDRKKYNVKSCIVLDKKEPTNLSKAYLVVMFQHPSKFYTDKNGQRKKDNKWHFAFKTKANCFELKEYTDYAWSGWFKVSPFTKHTISWKKDTKERERFNYFAQNHKVCTQIIESFKKSTEIATARYFQGLSGKQQTQVS